MTVETRVDGSIRFRDGFVFLRRGLLVASGLFFGLSGLAFTSGPGQLRFAWGEMIGALACAAFADSTLWLLEAGLRPRFRSHEIGASHAKSRLWYAAKSLSGVYFAAPIARGRARRRYWQ